VAHFPLADTACPHKRLRSRCDIGDVRTAVWSYQHAWEEARRIPNLLSFEPDKVSVDLDDRRFRQEPDQNVISHDMDLTTDQAIRLRPA
jgi:hypothetical protein